MQKLLRPDSIIQRIRVYFFSFFFIRNSSLLKVKNGRSFVRASGTEDVVRVYAEADTQAAADQLAITVCQLVYKMANGQGECPTSI